MKSSQDAGSTPAGSTKKKKGTESGAFLLLWGRCDANPLSEAILNFKLSQSFRRGWRFALAKLHALASVRSLRAQFKFPPVPPKKEVTFVYQKLLLFLSKPQAWYIIAAQRAVYIIKGALRPCISSRVSVYLPAA